MGGAEAAARKWSRLRRAEGCPRFVRSAAGPVRPAGSGAPGTLASVLRALSSGWRPRPASPGPALEVLVAWRLDWGVVSERGRGAARSRAGPVPVGVELLYGMPWILPSNSLTQTSPPGMFAGLLRAVLISLGIQPLMSWSSVRRFNPEGRIREG